MAGVSRRPRTVGLDKPCRVCGRPVHYTYTGPVEGVCGRCADKHKTKRPRPYHRGMVVSRGSRERRLSSTAFAVRVCLAILAGAAAVALALRYFVG